MKRFRNRGKKRIIETDEMKLVYDYISTYPNWYLLLGSDLMASSNNADDFFKAYDKFLDIGYKRGKRFYIIRTGTSERKSRIGEEIHLFFETPEEYVEHVYYGSPNNLQSHNQHVYYPPPQPQTFNITQEELNKLINEELNNYRHKLEQEYIQFIQTEKEKLKQERELIKKEHVKLRRKRYNIDDDKEKAVQNLILMLQKKG